MSVLPNGVGLMPSNVGLPPNVRLINQPKQKNTLNKVFLIVIIIVALLFIILFGYNSYLYNRIRLNRDETVPVSRTEANTLFWLNIIWIIVALAILIWAIIELIKLLSKKKTQAPLVYAQRPVVSQPVVAQPIVADYQRSLSQAPVPLYSTMPQRQVNSSFNNSSSNACRI